MSYIFDSHVHIFPEKIAEKASKNIGAFYNIPMNFDGSVAMLLELCSKYKVDKCLVHSVATTAEQVQSINNFIHSSVEENKDKFVGFCSLHPSMTSKEIEAEINRIKELGLIGIKLHPDFQLFNIDGKDAYKIYEIAENDLPILFHTGDYRYEYSSPNRLANALKDFPKLTVIGAHFGGWSEWHNGIKYLSDLPNVYVDTSSSLYELKPEQAKEYINAFGEDRVLFGSDYPMWSVGDEIELISKIDLPQSTMDKIMWQNACKLFNVNM